MQSGLDTTPVPVDILMWLLGFCERSGWSARDSAFNWNMVKKCEKSLFWLKSSRKNVWKRMELERSQRGKRVIAPANIKSRTEPKICERPPTLTGVFTVVSGGLTHLVLQLFGNFVYTAGCSSAERKQDDVYKSSDSVAWRLLLSFCSSCTCVCAPGHISPASHCSAEPPFGVVSSAALPTVEKKHKVSHKCPNV